MDILQAKTAIMKNIKKKIERFQTREQIIIKVLDIINQSENQEMFKQDDKEIHAEYEAVRKEWELKRAANERFRKMKENQHDFDYFIDNAQW